jgi:outer membrane beta-barrel protein
MKNFKSVTFFGLTFFSVLMAVQLLAGVAHASDLNSDLDSLGANDQVMNKVRTLNPDNQIGIVQNRIVDRNMRLEVDGLFGGVANGESYLSTMDYGVEAEFHIIPQFSLGARYIKSSNSITPQGQQVLNQYSSGQTNSTISKIDAPQSQVLATATWYMLYGKINFFDVRVTQFDIYSVVGGGQMNTQLGSSPTYTGGGGIAFWWSQHLSSRFEIRYQTYSDQAVGRLNTVVGTAGIGFLL